MSSWWHKSHSFFQCLRCFQCYFTFHALCFYDISCCWEQFSLWWHKRDSSFQCCTLSTSCFNLVTVQCAPGAMNTCLITGVLKMRLCIVPRLYCELSIFFMMCYVAEASSIFSDIRFTHLSIAALCLLCSVCQRCDAIVSAASMK